VTTKPAPPKCDQCDEHRQIERLDGTMARCPDCHPLSPRSLPALLAERDRLLADLQRVEQDIANHTAPDWARGPAPANRTHQPP
jgi:hypothetical protein